MTVTDEDKALLTLLRAKSTYQTSGGTMAEWINPDGPLAADRIEALEAENERLREALEEWVFRYAWKAEGMNTEQACIHAKAFMARAALEGKQ